jgi:hypothetical protein
MKSLMGSDYFLGKLSSFLQRKYVLDAEACIIDSLLWSILFVFSTQVRKQTGNTESQSPP